MIEKYKHISFDLDGTLVHTLPEYRHKIVPEVVKILNGHILNSHSVDRFWFESGRDRIIKEEFGLDPVIFWEIFRQKDMPENRAFHTKAYEDSERAIRLLKEKQKIVSIITGAPHDIATLEIEKLNKVPIDLYFPIWDKGFNSKPDPKSFKFVLNQLHIRPEETVYIGNSNEDAYFARNSGVDFIYLKRKEHQFNLEKYIIAKIESLDELFESF